MEQPKFGKEEEKDKGHDFVVGPDGAIAEKENLDDNDLEHMRNQLN